MAKQSSGNTGRVEEKSQLLIKWQGAKGEWLTERTETHDVSESGISFYLKTPIGVTRISQSRLPPALYSVVSTP
jgi:hypothetical protein